MITGSHMKIEELRPAQIEQRSMEIIENELGNTSRLSPAERLVVKRVIHATADFEYLENMKFSEGVCEKLVALFHEALGCSQETIHIVTDTMMALSGISKPAANALGIELHCFMADADVAQVAKEQGITRAVAAMEKAVRLYGDRPLIFAIGNAPTALIQLAEYVKAGRVRPALVIGVPVGFVNVVQSKELIMECDVPYIVAAGRKGGSTVAAAICNALLYQVYDRG